MSAHYDCIKSQHPNSRDGRPALAYFPADVVISKALLAYQYIQCIYSRSVLVTTCYLSYVMPQPSFVPTWVWLTPPSYMPVKTMPPLWSSRVIRTTFTIRTPPTPYLYYRTWPPTTPPAQPTPPGSHLLLSAQVSSSATVDCMICDRSNSFTFCKTILYSYPRDSLAESAS